MRNPEAIHAPAGVELIEGTPADIDDIRAVAQGADAVISALNNTRASDRDWTFARAVALSDKPAAGPLHAAEYRTEKSGTRVNRAYFAGFLRDTVERGSRIRKAPLVWNARA